MPPFLSQIRGGFEKDVGVQKASEMLLDLSGRKYLGRVPGDKSEPIIRRLSTTKL